MKLPARLSRNFFPTPLWSITLGWFAVWVVVGVFVVSLDLQVPGGAAADMVFLGLASLLIGMDQARRHGRWWSWIAFLWVAFFGGLIEVIGATTGWPFGSYLYTDRFGWLLGGVIPVTIPLAWWVVVLPLFALARSFTPLPPLSRYLLIPLFVGSGAVWVDLLLEPVAWGMRSYWIWTESGPYYGVPLQNFAGWFGVAWTLSVGLLALEQLTGTAAESKAPAPWAIVVLLSVILTFLAAAMAGGYGLAVLLGGALMLFLGGTQWVLYRRQQGAASAEANRAGRHPHRR